MRQFLKRAGLAFVLAVLFASSFGGTFTCQGRAGNVTFSGSSHRK